jgi:putative ABC transport system permease protein
MDDSQQVQSLVENLATELGVYVTEVRDAEAEIVALGREPYRVGFYGILSVGYIVSALITVTGYAFFTVFGMRRRAVQFAAFRAMGMSGWQTAGLIGLEQTLIVGTGVLTGWGLGALSTHLFLPFLRDRAGDFQRLPPFLIVTHPADTVRVLAVFALVLALGVALVVVSVSRLHVGRTVRLGEDQ